MDDHGEDATCCDFHPKQLIVGVCALCLKERLLVLASKQSHHPQGKKTKRTFGVLRRKKRFIRLPKVFALGPFLNRLESRYHRNEVDSDDEGSIASHEDSFISVKFDDDGQASWDIKEAAMSSIGPSKETNSSRKEISRNKSEALEQTKHSSNLKWRKRIGQLLHGARWKKSWIDRRI